MPSVHSPSWNTDQGVYCAGEQNGLLVNRNQWPSFLIDRRLPFVRSESVRHHDQPPREIHNNNSHAQNQNVSARLWGCGLYLPLVSSGHRIGEPRFPRFECQSVQWDPKGGDLYPATMKPWETVVEVGSITDVQIVCLSWA